jgi:hypothetical protein
MIKLSTGLKNKYVKACFAAFIFMSSLFFVPSAQAETITGLTVEVYTYDPSATPERQAYTPCVTDTVWTSVPNIDADWGGGVVAGCQDEFVLIHYSGYLTSPKSGDITFQSWADDGFYFSLDGTPVINDWTLKGCGGSSATVPMVEGEAYKFDAWWYEYGGGACNRLFWDAEGEGMNVISPNAFSNEPYVKPYVPSLSKPLGLNGIADGTAVTLVWGSVIEETAIESYAVMWTYGDNPGWGMASTNQSIVIPNLPEDTEITFRVRSDNNTLGVYSEFSEPIVIKTGFKPVVPPVEPPVEPPIEPEPPVEPEPPIEEPVGPVEPVIEPKPPVIPEEPVLPPVEPTEPEKPIVEIPLEVPTANEVINTLAEIEPSEMTSLQVEQLQEAALAAFEIAEVGSEEYEEALDALYIVAQADDIVVDEELASVPVLGAAVVGLTNAINFLGNIGADISPKVREESKKVVVGAVIATQIAQIAGATSLSTISRNGK